MAEQGRLKDAEEKFIEQTLPGIDYLAHYPGTIVSQSGQTFDFQPDDSRLPGLQGLAFYSGNPGVTIIVDPTQSPRAVLFFEGGNPGAPALAFFSFPALSLLQFGNDASLGAARVTDPVAAATSMAAWFSAVSTALSITPPTDFGTIASGSTQVQIG